MWRKKRKIMNLYTHKDYGLFKETSSCGQGAVLISGIYGNNFYIFEGVSVKEVDPNKMIAEVVKQFSKPIYDGTVAIGRDAFERLKVNLGICFTKYLERNYDKYSKTKTILYRDAPVKLNEIYVRTDLLLNEKLIKESEFINEIESNQRIIISGSAGTGKSTFCKSIFLDLIENPRNIFPIFIELRQLNDLNNKTILENIVDNMIKIDPSFSIYQLEYAIKLGKVMLILDGFDEINGEKREDFEKDIINIASIYQNILIVISSRPDNIFSSWDEFYQYNILPLDKEKSKTLISKLFYDRSVKSSFLNALDKELFEKHNSFASNPLLLTMMLMTYEQIAEIPNKIHLFYEQAFQTLFIKHDAYKNLYKRQSSSKLAIDDFKKVLSTFCILTYSNEEYYFEESKVEESLDKAIKICGFNVSKRDLLKDLRDNVCILQKDGLGYTFTHRSFQEYFSALYLVSFMQTDCFNIFDKISNIFDSVIPMVYDMNPELIEKEWIIPKIEKMIIATSRCKNKEEEKLYTLIKTFNGIHAEKNLEGNYDLNFTLSHNNHPLNVFYFYSYLTSIFSKEYFSFIKKYKSKLKPVNIRTDLDENLKKQFVENNFKNNTSLRFNNLSSMTKEAKLQLISLGICNRSYIDYEFSKTILAKIKSRHEKKKKSLNDYLFNTF